MTTFSLTWLATVLDNAGLKVAETPGWRSRGRADMPRPLGVMCHHTANPHSGNMPTLNMLINGRSDLPGPLCQLGLGRDGTFYVVAAGRANHAGLGRWQGVTTGNSSFIGIEAEHSGRPGDEWPAVQMDAYARGVAAILRHIGTTEKMCCGHKEYALPPNRKPDPTFDMTAFRHEVGLFMVGKSPPPAIPAVDAKARPTLRRGSRGDAVRELQTALGLDPDGVFGPRTEATLRARQRELGLVGDGIVGPKTWAVLQGEVPAPAQAAPPPPPPQTGGWSLGAKGAALIKSFEACEDAVGDGTFTAYPDPGSKDGRPWTIGWGSTGADVQKGTVWTQQQCDDRFDQEIVRYVADVARAIGDAPTTQNQFDAMVSFHYNTGKIFQATLTRRHIARDYQGAREAFAWWNKNDGKVMRGLVRRRRAEADLYAEP
ncbi:MAG TPA: glycoside hydrolase family protein [Allosphingosinicella sp.]|jgi:GH24 family phage-related lysozyme (muramidase)